MNATYRPQSRLMYQMPVTTVPNAILTAETPVRKATGLSARQLLDIELGLFLLTQLLPAAPPDFLPDLLTGAPVYLKNRPVWTARHYRYLNRARLLLNHFRERSCWVSQLEQYVTGSSFQQVYAISPEQGFFREKSVGFSRNRVSALRQMLG